MFLQFKLHKTNLHTAISELKLYVNYHNPYKSFTDRYISG
jgi:hypothetical protein